MKLDTRVLLVVGSLGFTGCGGKDMPASSPNSSRAREPNPAPAATQTAVPARPATPAPRDVAPAPEPGGTSQSCEAGNMKACRSSWAASCDAGDNNSCIQLGMALRDGKFGQRELHAAALTFEAACNRVKPLDALDGRSDSEIAENIRGARACSMLGLLYRGETSTPADLLRAAPFFRRACGAGEALGCVWLGDLYGRTKDWQQAKAHYGLACDLGNDFGCRMLAGAHIELGEWSSAMTAAQRSCPAIQRSCAFVGVMLCDGKGTKRDPTRAVQLLDQACSSNDAFACMKLGDAYNVGTCARKDPLRASEYYQHACDAKEYGACGLLGFQYLLGTGVPVDPARAKNLLETACRASLELPLEVAKTVCKVAGDLYLNRRAGQPDSARSVEYYTKSCELKEPAACYELGMLYSSGEGIPKSYPNAFPFLEFACSKRTPKACEAANALKQVEASCKRLRDAECAAVGF